jgi:hypothetical protein
MIHILLGMLVMAFKDAIGTFLTIAQARNRPVLAGALDAVFDLASILFMWVGAGAIMLHGLTPTTLATLGAMMMTSFLGTILWTRIGTKLASA